MGVNDIASLHIRYLAVVEQLASIAGIEPRYIRASMEGFCGPQEILWVEQFRQLRTQGVPGLILEAVSRPEVRCQAIAGALIRDLIDARVIPLSDLVTNPGLGQVPTVLLIPDFAVDIEGHEPIPPSAGRDICTMLLERAAARKPSVLSIQSLRMPSNDGRLFPLLNQYRVAWHISLPAPRAAFDRDKPDRLEAYETE